MSVTQIRAAIQELSPAERELLRREFFPADIDDPQYLAELDRRHAAMEAGLEIISREEMYARLGFPPAWK